MRNQIQLPTPVCCYITGGICYLSRQRSDPRHRVQRRGHYKKQRSPQVAHQRSPHRCNSGHHTERCHLGEISLGISLGFGSVVTLDQSRTSCEDMVECGRRYRYPQEQPYAPTDCLPQGPTDVDLSIISTSLPGQEAVWKRGCPGPRGRRACVHRLFLS